MYGSILWLYIPLHSYLYLGDDVHVFFSVSGDDQIDEDEFKASSLADDPG